VEGILIIEVDGDPDGVDAQAKEIQDLLRKHNASGVLAAKDQAEAQSLWTARRSAFSAMASLRPNSITEDATVPVSKLTTMIRKVNEIAERHRVQVGVLAHAGDGNLHPLLLFDQRDPEEVERVEAASEEIFRDALAFGGTLSGEHGIGLAKARFLDLEMDSVARRVMRDVKKALDPKGILNPGKFV
jgi:glycolate oxidase